MLVLQLIQMVSGDDCGGEEINLRCPYCRFGYTHIEEVYTRNGTDEHENGAYKGTTIKKGESSGHRRSALVIRFSCEGEHNWNFVIQQHKGHNFLTLEKLPDYKPEKSQGADPFAPL